MPAGVREPTTAPAILLVVVVAAALLAVGLSPILMTVSSGVGAVERRFFEKIDRPLEIPALEERSTIVAADGSVLQRVHLNYNRHVIPLRKVNEVTREAVLAIEDSNFFAHGAIDPTAIVRAAMANIGSGQIVQGGSTIAQQLVKGVTGDTEQTFTRKIREAVDAVRLENTYSKRDIFEMYLNQVYLGNGAYGIAAAAEFYFGKEPKKLRAKESALLAGMIRAPEDYDPLEHPKAALKRRNHVLDEMRQLGWIGERKHRRSLRSPLGLSRTMRESSVARPDSYWSQYVIHEFLSNPAFGKTRNKRAKLLFQGGVRVHTTLDPDLQRRAEVVLESRMSGRGMPQSALVAIEPDTGEIRTMAIGNAPWGERHQYNLAVNPGGGRTAGSAFKAFTVVAALEAGISPNKVYDGGSPKTIEGCGGGEDWKLQNAEPGGGRFPLWNATAHSVNTVFAQVIDEIGPYHVADVARRMGITNEMVPVCPLTLGTSPVSPLQMTAGYATLANRGVSCKPTAITKVVDTNGEVIFRAKPNCERVIAPWIADETTAMLERVITSGTGAAASIGRPAAGKTGTGQEYQDAWFMGYTPQLATGVWVGYARAEIPMPYVPGYGRGYGGVLAAPIWRDFMLFAMKGEPIIGFPPPPIPFHQYSPPSPSSRSDGGQGSGGGGGGNNGHGPGGGGPPGQDD